MKLTAALVFLLNIGCGTATLPVANTALDASWMMLKKQCPVPSSRCDNLLNVYNAAQLAYNAAVVAQGTEYIDPEPYLKEYRSALSTLLTELAR